MWKVQDSGSEDRTTTDFSKKITLDGYVAYGTKDQMFKYNAGITYSLTHKDNLPVPCKIHQAELYEGCQDSGSGISVCPGR